MLPTILRQQTGKHLTVKEWSLQSSNDPLFFGLPSSCVVHTRCKQVTAQKEDRVVVYFRMGRGAGAVMLTHDTHYGIQREC